MDKNKKEHEEELELFPAARLESEVVDVKVETE